MHAPSIGQNRGDHRGSKRCGNEVHVGWAVERRLDRGPVPGDDGPFAQLKECGIRRDHAVVHRLDIRKTAHGRTHGFLSHHVCEVNHVEAIAFTRRLRGFKRGNGARLTHSLPFEPYDEGCDSCRRLRGIDKHPRTTMSIPVMRLLLLRIACSSLRDKMVTQAYREMRSKSHATVSHGRRCENSMRSNRTVWRGCRANGVRTAAGSVGAT